MSGRSLPPAQYRLLVESSPVMVWRSGLDAKCDYFNETWLAFTGRTFEQELGDGWAEGVHPDDLDRCVEIYLDHFGRHAVLALEKLARVFGPGQAPGVLTRVLGEMGIPGLGSMEDLDRFAQHLKARGGVEAAVGAALSVQMLMRRIQRFGEVSRG